MIVVAEEPVLDDEMAKFILSKVGDKFCELVEQEKEAKSLSGTDRKLPTGSVCGWVFSVQVTWSILGILNIVYLIYNVCCVNRSEWLLLV